MSDYPYSGTPAQIRPFFDRLRDVGVPEKAIQTWLEAMGFKSKNHRTLLKILKFIGFTDNVGTPQQMWKDYRGNSKRTMARAIKGGYKELFNFYPDANARSVDEIKDFFRTKTAAGAKVVDLTAATFLALCSMADLKGGAKSAPDSPSIAHGGTQGAPPESKREEPPKISKDVAINVNVQINLPSGADAKTYDAIFKSMKKHLVT